MTFDLGWLNEVERESLILRQRLVLIVAGIFEREKFLEFRDEWDKGREFKEANRIHVSEFHNYMPEKRTEGDVRFPGLYPDN